MVGRKVYNSNQIARLNLLKIAHDPILGATNAGWCYMFAPLRSYLTNPDFLQVLHEYKQQYYINGRPTFNGDFLEAFFGIELEKIKNSKEAVNVCDIINTLALSTDDNCRIVNSRNLYNLIHRLEKQSKTDDPIIMMNYLTTCTAVMNETLDTIKPNVMVKLNEITPYQLQDLERRLKNGECITVGASNNHIYNVYKNNGHYFVTGTSGLNVGYNDLYDALTSWIANHQYHYDQKGNLIFIDNPFYGYYTLSKGEISDKNKIKRINEYYRQLTLTPEERQMEAKIKNKEEKTKECRLRFIYDLKWKKEKALQDAILKNDVASIHKNNDDIIKCVNQINNFAFKEINNSQKLSNLLNELSGKKNPYI